MKIEDFEGIIRKSNYNALDVINTLEQNLAEAQADRDKNTDILNQIRSLDKYAFADPVDMIRAIQGIINSEGIGQIPQAVKRLPL